MKFQILLSTKRNATLKEVILRVQTSIKGERLNMNAKTGICIPAKYYVNGGGGSLKKPTQRAIQTAETLEYAKSYNDLSAMIAYLEAEYTKANKDSITKSWLNDAVKAYRFGRTSSERPTFEEHREAFLKHLDDSKIADNTRKNYNDVFSAVCRYVAFVRATQKDGRGFSFDVDTLTCDDIFDFRDYLRNEHELAKEYPKAFSGKVIRARGDNTIIGMLIRLRAFFNWLNKTDRTDNNPFAKMDNWSKQVFNAPIFLTMEEVYQVAASEMPSKPMERQRDIFVLHCHLGCRVSDLETLTEDNICDGLLTYAPIKTRKHGTIARVGIDPDAAAIIEKYRNNKKGTLIPTVSASGYDRAIKRVLAVAGINRKVSVRDSVSGKVEQRPICEVAASHTARKTFIANYADAGVEIALIKAMSGHKQDGSSIWRYTEYSDERIKEAAARAWQTWQDHKEAKTKEAKTKEA